MRPDFTPLARPYFAIIAKRADAGADRAALEKVQMSVLRHLLRRARHTDIARRSGFDGVDSYAAFAAAVPVVEYEDIRPDVMRMVDGEPDVLWPGRCRRYAQSSGTSGGKSKYIPVTDESLARNHYVGGSVAVARYLQLYPDSHLFQGKSFILGGSFANELPDLPAGVKVGDVSASLIDNINPVVNLFRVPSKAVALMPDWHAKLPALVEASIGQDIRSISGVPSWFMTVIQHVLERTGASNIHQVWPNLEVFFHGGIAFGPYREQYRALTDPSKMRYLENYNASEGFFAVQDLPEGGGVMRLLVDAGVFYEFIPLDRYGQPGAEAIPAWEVEAGRTYALVISGTNGLWRYVMGDTVRVESVEPLRITIAGRTRSFINAFGEELMVWNADTAIERACARTGAHVANYTAAPVYAEGGHKGHHQWLIEWTREPEGGIEAFADILDSELCAVNSDYQAKRTGGLFLDRLSIVTAPTGAFDAWLESTGKLGGQRKVPRLSNDRRVIDPILESIAKPRS